MPFVCLINLQYTWQINILSPLKLPGHSLHPDNPNTSCHEHRKESQFPIIYNRVLVLCVNPSLQRRFITQYRFHLKCTKPLCPTLFKQWTLTWVQIPTAEWRHFYKLYFIHGSQFQYANYKHTAPIQTVHILIMSLLGKYLRKCQAHIYVFNRGNNSFTHIIHCYFFCRKW